MEAQVISKLLAANTVSLGKNNEEATSQNKVETNRRNAQFSTGPTSAKGKKASSQNASKHGLLIKDVVITNRGGKEDQGEFDALLGELCDSYRPSDIVEDLLVRELAISYWKSARALRCERGDVTCARETSDESELTESEIDRLRQYTYGSLLRSSHGIEFLLLGLDQAQVDVIETGSVRTELHQWLAPGRDWRRAAFSTNNLLSAALEDEHERLTVEKGRVEKGESQRRSDERDRWAIPGKEALDRIYRYETSNLRHRYKVETRLELLQARRRENAKENSGESNDVENSQDAQFCEPKPSGSGDGGSRKGPHRVGLAGQTTDDSAIPPIKTDVPAVEPANIDLICETKPTGSDDGLGKSPHSIGPAGPTSDDSGTPPLKPDVPAVEPTIIDAICETKPTGSADGLG
jgi:hypothetical protein